MGICFDGAYPFLRSIWEYSAHSITAESIILKDAAIHQGEGDCGKVIASKGDFQLLVFHFQQFVALGGGQSAGSEL